MTWMLPVAPGSIVVEIVVMGDPIPHQRPRFTGGRGPVLVYTPEKSRLYKEVIAWTLKAHTVPCKLTEPLGLQAKFYRSMRHRVDVDNLLKSILDACTLAQVWRDDAQVREVAARLWVGVENPRVEFVVYRLEEL